MTHRLTADIKERYSSCGRSRGRARLQHLGPLPRLQNRFEQRILAKRTERKCVCVFLMSSLYFALSYISHAIELEGYYC